MNMHEYILHLYRRIYLKRNVSDEVQIRAFEMLEDKSYSAVANCIIGMPDETRDLIFDTIRFVRKLPKNIDATGAYVFAPYHGTELRDIAVKKGYIKNPDSICDITRPEDSMLDQPQLPRKELIGLASTFGLYQTLPKSKWKWVKKAEEDTEEAKKLRIDLLKDYRETTTSNSTG